MRCPVCGALVDDNLSVCPACHADLSSTHSMPKLHGTWCPTCGALVPSGSVVCPKCGMPVDADASRIQAVPDPEDDELGSERERTRTLPRIESAIPSEPDPAVESVYGRERLPHAKVFVLAAIASLLVVGGATLAITHPWDPSLSDPRAVTAADTSQAGFPGTVAHLQGQDSITDLAESVASADETTFSDLMSAYDSLGNLSQRADESSDAFDQIATSGTSDERAQKASDAKQLALDVSNLIASIKQIDVTTTGTYTDQREHISTLASWLRNRVDKLNEAWTLSADSSDPARNASKIKAAMEGQGVDDNESFAALFAKNYDAWKPYQR